MAEEAELDIDVELNELENRLERLRALYEQYFLGIEKLEPTVPRKDVDRRIYLMRRAKIRNTGKRFKLQVIIQRYNTFQQYWARICREIENGTYRRHLLKAEKVLGEPLTIAAKKRSRGSAKLLDEVKEAEAPAAAPQAPADDLDDILGLRPTPPPVARPGASAVPIPKAARAPTLPPDESGAGGERPRYKFEKLDLDIDDLIGGGSASNRPVAARPGPVAAARPPSSSTPFASPRPITPASPTASAPPSAEPPVDRAGRVKPPLPTRAKPPLPSRAPTSAPEPPPASTRPLPSSTSNPKPAPPRVGPPPPRVGPPVSQRRPPPAAPPPEPAPPPSAARRPAPAPAPGPKPAPAAPAARPAQSGLSDERVRELHARLSDAKRQVNDAKPVSVDGLARQLRSAEEKIRQQHAGRRVDFDVVIKDGKAIVKPIVK